MSKVCIYTLYFFKCYHHHHSFYNQRCTFQNGIFEGATKEENKEMQHKIDAAKAQATSYAPPLHAVLLVGYGKNDGGGYFLAQNSAKLGSLWIHKGQMKGLALTYSIRWKPIERRVMLFWLN